MRSIIAMLDDLDTVVEELAAADLEVLAPPERFAVLDRLEIARRRQVAVAHAVVARLEQFPGCPPVPVTLADVLRISPREARRRIRDAEQLAPRTTLTGEPVPPVLPETAKVCGTDFSTASTCRSPSDSSVISPTTSHPPKWRRLRDLWPSTP